MSSHFLLSHAVSLFQDAFLAFLPALTFFFAGILSSYFRETWPPSAKVVAINEALSEEVSEFDPITSPDHTRFVLFPIRYDEMWKAYKDILHTSWAVENHDILQGRELWISQFTDEEKFFTIHSIACFIVVNCLLLEKIPLRLCSQIGATEAIFFFGYELRSFSVHLEAFNCALEALVPDFSQRNALVDLVSGSSGMTQREAWLDAMIGGDELDFPSQVVAASVAVSLFSVHLRLCLVWWLERGVLSGACSSLSNVCQDLERFENFGGVLLRGCGQPCAPPTFIDAIIASAVDLEKRISGDNDYLLPKSLEHISVDRAIESIADDVSLVFGRPRRYGPGMMRLNQLKSVNFVAMNNNTSYRRLLADRSFYPAGDVMQFDDDF